METLVSELIECMFQNTKAIKQLLMVLKNDSVFISGGIRQPGNEAFFVFGDCCFSIQRIVKKDPDSSVPSSTVHVLHCYPEYTTDTQSLLNRCNSVNQPITISFDCCQEKLESLLNAMEGEAFNVDDVFARMIEKYAKKPSNQESV